MDKKEVKAKIEEAVDTSLRKQFAGAPVHRSRNSWYVGESKQYAYEIVFPAGFLSPSQMIRFSIMFTRDDSAGQRTSYYRVPTKYRKTMVENYCRSYEKTLHEAGSKNFKVSSLKKFAIRSWWGKEEIHFQDMAELGTWLRVLVPLSVENFAQLVRKA